MTEEQSTKVELYKIGALVLSDILSKNFQRIKDFNVQVKVSDSFEENILLGEYFLKFIEGLVAGYCESENQVNIHRMNVLLRKYRRYQGDRTPTEEKASDFLLNGFHTFVSSVINLFVANLVVSEKQNGSKLDSSALKGVYKRLLPTIRRISAQSIHDFYNREGSGLHIGLRSPEDVSFWYEIKDSIAIPKVTPALVPSEAEIDKYKVGCLANHALIKFDDDDKFSTAMNLLSETLLEKLIANYQKGSAFCVV